MTSKPKRLHTFQMADDEWAAFVRIVRETNPEISTSGAIRELIRWYTHGCGEKLKLTVPILFRGHPPQ